MPGRPTIKRKMDGTKNNGRTQTKKSKKSTANNGTKKVSKSGKGVEGELQEDIQFTPFEVVETQTQARQVQAKVDLHELSDEVLLEEALNEVDVQEAVVEVGVQDTAEEVQVPEVPVVPHISDLLKSMRKRKSNRILKLKLGKRVGNDGDPGNSKEKSLNIE
ncbi:unnamed protein product [Lactuca virosa]|uniref:Uncharacterized protein n=1 Tax=Lactuca virosa TaxID=75947 RepID=A0AAU9MQ08_9ASTR|nr:unnamed protein product [Lactuca virosa]CAH1429040.1 unnamed protein product [Lactuca virosa]